MTRPETAFSPQTVVLLITVGLLAFAGAAYFMVFGDSGRSSGANSLSKSAIGHMAFVELLRRQDVSVIVSRNDSAAKASPGSLLVVAEPLAREIETAGGILRAARTLIVLPKWRGSPDPNHPGWIGQAAMLQTKAVEKILRDVLPDGAVRRPSLHVTWLKASSSAMNVFRPGRRGNDLLWRRMLSRAAPAIDKPQLIVSPTLTPIIASPDGILVGGLKLSDGWVFLISDPDLLSNHGIGRDDNAALFLDAMAFFQPDGGPVIIDETMHGFHSNPNFWRKLFELPFLVPTILALIAL